MDHRAFIKSLSQEQRRELTTKSNSAGLIHLVLYIVALIVAGSIIYLELPFWQIALPLHGALIVFLFTLMHEVIHRTVFEKRWANDAVAWLCGIIIILPPAWFRYFHFAHHRHTQDPDNDPELASPKPETTWQYWKHISGIPIWVGQVKTLFTNALSSPEYDYVPDAGRADLKMEARVMLTLYGLAGMISVIFISKVLIWLWIIPALIGQPLLRFYLLAEHGRCAFVANMFENSRTTFTNRIVRFIAWNMPYHSEHHALPTVPFHKLPEFHRLTAEHLKETEQGYARFNSEYISSLERR